MRRMICEGNAEYFSSVCVMVLAVQAAQLPHQHTTRCNPDGKRVSNSGGIHRMSLYSSVRPMLLRFTAGAVQLRPGAGLSRRPQP